MKRRLLPTLACISFVLSLYALVNWLRASFEVDWVLGVHAGRVYEIYSECGTLHVERLPYPALPSDPLWSYRDLRGPCGRGPHTWLQHAAGGFRWKGGPTWMVAVPFWTFAAITAALPAWWVRRHGRRQHVGLGLLTAFGTWPLVLMTLFDPTGDWREPIALWVCAALTALAVLVSRDLLLLGIAHRVMPWQVRARRLHARRLAGLCLKCGYDLRGSPGRCPECGTVSTPAAPDDASRPVSSPPPPSNE